MSLSSAGSTKSVYLATYEGVIDSAPDDLIGLDMSSVRVTVSAMFLFEFFLRKNGVLAFASRVFKLTVVVLTQLLYLDMSLCKAILFYYQS